jgi:hypothetical protein
MVCTCGHDDHAWDEPTVCKIIDCNCIHYTEATETNIIISKHTEYLQHFQHVKDQISWILDNLKYLRNSKNSDFVDFYFQYVKVYTPRGQKPKTPDYETIRRVKQLLVSKMPDRYGPYDETITLEKSYKQLAVQEFATQ